jgi:hypothetical protein
MPLPVETSNKPLPKIDVPTYKVKIPSSDKEIRVRPFSVKEEKLLFMAVESGKLSDMIDTTKQVINNCIISGDFNVDKAPFFDIDFLFIFLRAKSVGESVEVNLTCNNTLDDGKRCGHTFPTNMDISNHEMLVNERLSSDIKLDASSGVRMKYPNYSVVKSMDEVPDIEKKTKVIINSLEHIYDKKGVYSAKDYSTKELQDFVEGLTEEKYKLLEEWVDSFPTFVVKLEADCPKCGFHHEVRYSDFADFFY